MKIWFSTTTLNYKEYKDYYHKIREYLIETGHILTDDWIGKHEKWIENNPEKERDIKKLYELVLKSINEADVSIIEFTVPNFSTSHQITYSIQKQKPTLVLRLHKDNTFKDSYIEALESPYLKIVDYNLQNYKDIISEFLGYAEIEEGQKRYNIMLGNKHKYYLDWASTKYKTSRSQIIKDLIDKKMSEDEKFKIYIK